MPRHTESNPSAPRTIMDRLARWLGRRSGPQVAQPQPAVANDMAISAPRHPRVPAGARRIGYHGTDADGMRSLLGHGFRPMARLRSGMPVPEREPVFYIADHWEAARSYAARPEAVVEVWCSNLDELVHDTFRRNVQGVNEVKLLGGFETLTMVPADLTRHLPVSFQALGFGQRRGAFHSSELAAPELGLDVPQGLAPRPATPGERESPAHSQMPLRR